MDPIDFGLIASRLAKMNRMTGRHHPPFTLAQRSVLLAQACPTALRAHALLHHAWEAVVVDQPRRNWDFLARDDITGRVYAAANLAGLLPVPRNLIRARDMDLRATERRDLDTPAGEDYDFAAYAEPFDAVIRPATWAQSEQLFRAAIDRYLVRPPEAA